MAHLPGFGDKSITDPRKYFPSNRAEDFGPRAAPNIAFATAAPANQEDISATGVSRTPVIWKQYRLESWQTAAWRLSTRVAAGLLPLYEGATVSNA